MVLKSRRQMLIGVSSGAFLAGCKTMPRTDPNSTAFRTNLIPSITQEFITIGKRNRPGSIISPTRITLHNTGNTSKGADAKAHSKFVRNNGFYTLESGERRTVSWHFTVDDRHIIQHLPKNEEAYHAGAGNKSSIGIEICMNKGIEETKVKQNVAWLVASLANEHYLPLDSIVTHKFWTGKNCPITMLHNGLPNEKWRNTLNAIEAEIAAQIFPMKASDRQTIDLSNEFVIPDPSAPEIDEGLLVIPTKYLSL